MTMYKIQQYLNSPRYADEKAKAVKTELSVAQVDPNDAAISAPGLLFNKI